MLWLRRLVWIAFFVAMLVFGWTFAHRNAEPLHVDYLFGTLAAPGWLVEVATFLLGGIAATLLFGLHAARLGQRNGAFAPQQSEPLERERPEVVR